MERSSLECALPPHRYRGHLFLGKNSENAAKLNRNSESGSRRQRQLAVLQEAADGRVALEADRDFVRLAGFGVRARFGQ
jgi:hypothetical protein